MIRPATAVVLLASTSLLATTSACRMSGSARTALVVSGAAVAVGGVAVAQSGAVDSDNNGTNDYAINDDFGKYALGSALVLGGLAMVLTGVTAQSPAPDEARIAGPAPLPGPIVVRSNALPQLVLEHSTVTSPVTPFAIDLSGWSIGLPYAVDGRTHVTAVDDNAQLELAMQQLVRPITPAEAVSRIDLSQYGSLARRDVRLGAMPAVELSGASGTTPVLVVVAIGDQQLLSMVCRGELDGCRAVVARSTWTHAPSIGTHGGTFGGFSVAPRG
jgi:hypothetical protein